MLNQCNFIGRLGKEPDLKYTPQGKAVMNLSIACTEKWKDNEKTEWVNLIFWDKLAEISAKYLHKGSLIFVSGKLQTTSYDDKEGVKRYKTEVVAHDMKMLDGKKDHEAPVDRPASDNDVPF